MQNPVRFDDYYLIERIAVGGMAEVFKGVSYGAEGFERLSAVKRVLPHIAEDKEFIEMFIDEAKIVAQLQHPNIGQVFHLGQSQGKYFIAMEYIPGQNLRSVFEKARRNQEPLDVGLCAYLVKEVCEALDYAHRKTNAKQEPLHLIHRDISPQNVILSYDGSVKLIDFGIAKAEGKRNQTQVGILKGKFSYMSPEQARGNPLDARSDLFALAAVLYELVTLERCFLGQSDFSTIERVRNLEFVPPKKIRRDIPPQLENIILKGLAKDPAIRFQSAADFQEALNRFIYTHYQSSNKPLPNRKLARHYMETQFKTEIHRENERLNEFRGYATQHIPEAQMMAQVSTTKFSSAQTDISHLNPEPRLSLNFTGSSVNAQTVPAVPPVSTSSLSSRISILVLLALLTGTLTTAFLWISKNEVGRLHIKGDPVHEVQFTLKNDQIEEKGVIPARISMLPVGNYTLTFSSKVYQPLTRNISIRSDQPTLISPKLKLNPRLGEVRILSNPSNVRVWVNDKQQGKTPLHITSELGQLKIRLKLDGFYSQQDTITVINGVKDYSYLLYPKKINVSVIPSVAHADIYIKESEAVSWRRIGQGSQSFMVNNDGRVKIQARAKGYINEDITLIQSVQREVREIISLTQDSKSVHYPSPLSHPSTGSSTPTLIPESTSQADESNRELKDSSQPKMKKEKKVKKKKRPKKRSRKPVRKASVKNSPPQVEEKEDTQPGLLNMIAYPAAEVFIKNRSLGWTPLRNYPLEPGRHRIKLKLMNGEVHYDEIRMQSGVITRKKWKKKLH